VRRGRDRLRDAYGVYQMCMELRHPEMVYDLSADIARGLTEVFRASGSCARPTPPTSLVAPVVS